MIYPRTNSDHRTESQCKSRNSFLDETQTEDELHRGGG